MAAVKMVRVVDVKQFNQALDYKNAFQAQVGPAEKFSVPVAIVPNEAGDLCTLYITEGDAETALQYIFNDILYRSLKSKKLRSN